MSLDGYYLKNVRNFGNHSLDGDQSYSERSPRWYCAVWIVLLVLPGGCSRPKNQKTTQTQTQSGIAVTATTVPNVETPGNTTVAAPGPPHSGDNTVELDITDVSTNRPMNDATVYVTPNMVAPRLAGQQVSGRYRGNGRYEAPIRLGIAAKYNLVVQVVPHGKQAVSFTFPIEAWQ